MQQLLLPEREPPRGVLLIPFDVVSAPNLLLGSLDLDFRPRPELQGFRGAHRLEIDGIDELQIESVGDRYLDLVAPVRSPTVRGGFLGVGAGGDDSDTGGGQAWPNRGRPQGVVTQAENPEMIQDLRLWRPVFACITGRDIVTLKADTPPPPSSSATQGCSSSSIGRPQNGQISDFVLGTGVYLPELSECLLPFDEDSNGAISHSRNWNG